MFDDGDDILDTVGLVLAFLIVAGVGISILAAQTAPSRADDAPAAEFRFQQINDTHVRVAHAGGEPISADDVVVTVDGVQRQVTWDSDTLRKGDDVVVEASSGSLVRVFWDAGEGNRERLARFRIE